jgi:diadenosine tetraphosphatase ApaH/serine/threonine PP2A family protein phosphatase
MLPRDILFCGHTHIQAISNKDQIDIPTLNTESEYLLQRDGKVIVNVGSVGKPRIIGDDKATYVVYDSDADRITFFQVTYDYHTTREKVMEIKGLPEAEKIKLALSLGPYKR